MASKKEKHEIPQISPHDAIERFRAEHELTLRLLAQLLDAAGISHYSSGCGNKSVTFDLFPASAYVKEFLSLFSLEREFRSKTRGGFRDADLTGPYNPAMDFIQYLRRWSLFTEQTMRTEGASPRGIAAAKAKLLLDTLCRQLGEHKTGNALRTTHLAALLRIIATTLSEKHQEAEAAEDSIGTRHAQRNYAHALAAAQEEFDLLKASAS